MKWISISAGPSNRLLNLNPEGSNGDSSIVSPRMVLKRVIKSSTPHQSKKHKKAKVKPDFTVSIPPSSECVEMDSTPIGVKNGNCSKLKIKIKPILPKVTQSGFPFVFANSDSEHSQRVIRQIQIFIVIIVVFSYLLNSICLIGWKPFQQPYGGRIG